MSKEYDIQAEMQSCPKEEAKTKKKVMDLLKGMSGPEVQFVKSIVDEVHDELVQDAMEARDEFNFLQMEGFFRERCIYCNKCNIEMEDTSTTFICTENYFHIGTPNDRLEEIVNGLTKSQSCSNFELRKNSK